MATLKLICKEGFKTAGFQRIRAELEIKPLEVVNVQSVNISAPLVQIVNALMETGDYEGVPRLVAAEDGQSFFVESGESAGLGDVAEMIGTLLSEIILAPIDAGEPIAE